MGGGPDDAPLQCKGSLEGKKATRRNGALVQTRVSRVALLLTASQVCSDCVGGHKCHRCGKGACACCCCRCRLTTPSVIGLGAGPLLLCRRAVPP